MPPRRPFRPLPPAVRIPAIPALRNPFDEAGASTICLLAQLRGRRYCSMPLLNLLAETTVLILSAAPSSINTIA